MHEKLHSIGRRVYGAQGHDNPFIHSARVDPINCYLESSRATVPFRSLREEFEGASFHCKGREFGDTPPTIVPRGIEGVDGVSNYEDGFLSQRTISFPCLLGRLGGHCHHSRDTERLISRHGTDF